MKKWAAVLPLMLVATGGAVAQENDVEPYAQAFCGLREADGGAGRLYLLSPSLSAAVQEALAKNAELQAAAPDEKPPLGDGVPYQSQPDLAPLCEPGAVTTDEGGATIAEIVYSFPDDAGAGWSDRLVLVEGDGGVYVIDDIRYGAEGDEDTLRHALEQAFAE